MENKLKNRNSLNWVSWFLIVTLTVTVLLSFLKMFNLADLNIELLRFCRVLTILLFGSFAWRKKSLTIWILFGLVAGAEFGYDLPKTAGGLQFLSEIFLRMIKTIIAPLLFATLVNGIAGHTDLKQVGRMGWKSLLYFEIASTLALVIGLIAINVSKAGVGINLSAITGNIPAVATKMQTTQEFILHIFPENIAKAIAEGNILQIVIFSIIFGIALSMLNEKYKSPMLKLTASLTEVMFKFTGIVMYFAPVAVFASIAFTIGHMGTDVLFTLMKLLATLYVALIAFLLLVLFPIALLFRIPVLKFMEAVSKPASIAFATANSESALPSAMESMEAFGVPRKIVSFVIPTGYSFNLDGSTLYLSLAAVFVAQAAGIDLSIEKQIAIALTLMLTSKGVAGVSRASFVILLGTVTTFGLPVEPVMIILGIDVLLDMARTGVNVIGNCLATAVIARWEGEFDEKKALADRI
ncbi:MAG: cation:dicarboxylase symporter family transporter [Bacteroidia bacterium]|nr:cation:dicarboxylase symporter family transporter [Bacteroidia bacterium]